jgi:hypothetical protein
MLDYVITCDLYMDQGKNEQGRARVLLELEKRPRGKLDKRQPKDAHACQPRAKSFRRVAKVNPDPQTLLALRLEHDTGAPIHLLPKGHNDMAAYTAQRLEFGCVVPDSRPFKARSLTFPISSRPAFFYQTSL